MIATLPQAALRQLAQLKLIECRRRALEALRHGFRFLDLSLFLLLFSHAQRRPALDEERAGRAILSERNACAFSEIWGGLRNKHF